MNVFDSLNLFDIEVQNQICAILKQESTYVTANRVPIQQQQGSADCGLFPIATQWHYAMDTSQTKYFSDRTNCEDISLNI